MEVKSWNLSRSRCTFSLPRLVNSTTVQDITVELVYSEQIGSSMMGVYETVLRNSKPTLSIYLRTWMGIRNLLEARLGNFYVNHLYLHF